MNVLAVDPGKFHAGCAVFVDGQLFSARTLRSKNKNPAFAAREIGEKVRVEVKDVPVRKVVCELPNVRKRQNQKGDPNDLLYLMLTNGAVCASVDADEYELVEVNRWKGSVTKEIMKGRITGDWGDYHPPGTLKPSRLTAAELQTLGAKPSHNTLDAVGIGLWTLRRL